MSDKSQRKIAVCLGQNLAALKLPPGHDSLGVLQVRLILVELSSDTIRLSNVAVLLGGKGRFKALPLHIGWCPQILDYQAVAALWSPWLVFGNVSMQIASDLQE